MSTPPQGPGMWQQGNREQALDWLADLDPRQQQALRRTIQTFEAAGPMFNAAARVREISNRTAVRLTGLRDRTTQRAAGAATRTGRTVAAMSDLAQRAVDGAVGAGDRAAGRATAARGRAVDAGLQLAGTVVQVGRQVAGNVSRWWQEKRGAATVRAAAVQGAFQAARQDPQVLAAIGQSRFSPQQLLEMNQRLVKAVLHPDPQQFAHAMDEFRRLAETVRGEHAAPGPHGGTGPEASTGQTERGRQTGGQHVGDKKTGGQHAADKKSGLPAWALSGSASPKGAATTPRTPGDKRPGEPGKPGKHRQEPGRHR